MFCHWFSVQYNTICTLKVKKIPPRIDDVSIDSFTRLCSLPASSCICHGIVFLVRKRRDAHNSTLCSQHCRGNLRLVCTYYFTLICWVRSHRIVSSGFALAGFTRLGLRCLYCRLRWLDCFGSWCHRLCHLSGPRPCCSGCSSSICRVAKRTSTRALIINKYSDGHCSNCEHRNAYANYFGAGRLFCCLHSGILLAA